MKSTMSEKLQFYGWTHTHNELQRLLAQYRSGLRRPVMVWLKFSNGETLKGQLVFAEFSQHYIVVQTPVGNKTVSRYRITEMSHNCDIGASMQFSPGGQEPILA